MTISRKLYALFGAALMFTVALGLTSWRSLAHIANQIEASSLSTQQLEMAGEVGYLTSNMLSTQRGMVVRAIVKDPELIEKYNSQFLQDATRRQHLLKEYEALTTSESALQLIHEMMGKYAQTIETHDQLYRLAQAGDGSGAAALQKDTLMDSTAYVRDRR